MSYFTIIQGTLRQNKCIAYIKNTCLYFDWVFYSFYILF